MIPLRGVATLNFRLHPTHPAENSVVTASIVSHGHGTMVARLVEDLLDCPEIAKILVTQNIPEDVAYANDERLEIILNSRIRGYGANQNAAFAKTDAPFFCVLNPDLRLTTNPFPQLLDMMRDASVALSGPRILAPSGAEEDSARRFPTLRNLAVKAVGAGDGTYVKDRRQPFTNPDWLAGMFLLLRSEAYRQVGGFDENFFLYYEDVDLCSRLRRSGYEIRQHRSAEVIHDARRNSRRNWRFALWHLRSMARYLWKNRAL